MFNISALVDNVGTKRLAELMNGEEHQSEQIFPYPSPNSQIMSRKGASN